MNNTFNRSTIEVVDGTMYSEKSKYLVERGRRAEKYANVRVYYFKPVEDKDRFGGDIGSRDNGNVREEAMLFDDPKELLEIRFPNRPSLLIIDEGQFCRENIVPVVRKLALEGHNVVIGGLLKDYRGQPFGFMPQLLAVSDHRITMRYAVCNIDGCSEDGILPQRLRNGDPDSALNPTVVVDGSDDSIEYEPRCYLHHIVPDLSDYLELELS